MTAIALFLAAGLAAQQGATELRAPIAEVTVFPGSALVRRSAQVQSGAGRFVVSGLPAGLMPESVRVRCSGAAVVGTETRSRFQPSVPDTRIAELRQREQALRRELVALQDDAHTLEAVQAHLRRSLEAPAPPAREDAPAIALRAWSSNLEFVTGELARSNAGRRSLARSIAEVEVRLADVAAELGRSQSGEGVNLVDVVVELAGGSGAAQLDVEYLVAGASWEPIYDLRASTDGRKVELGYRASVAQSTGEDWNEVALALSTATPRLGAQGPDPEPIWLSLTHPRPAAAPGERQRAVSRQHDAEELEGESDRDSGAWQFEARVESQGVSMRFALARRETILSRPDATSVLVGQATLESTPEYFCAPELDSTVWLRGRTVNSSAWTLLPGRASVYFGADYLGSAAIASVQPGAEFTLHLGPDPALAVERVVLEDTLLEAGLFSSNVTRRQSFRVRIENHGAAIAGADGAAAVFVREGLPRSRDERIEVELSSPRNKPLSDARFAKEREERGVVTWLVSVPKNGEATLEVTRKIAYPEGATLLGN
jgi:uncharacterized protein (TIGR02231 family)